MPETECEFVEICDPHRLACQGDLKDCPMVEFIHDYENSPQFKKQYAPLSVVKKVLESLPNKNDDFVRDVMAEIEVVGRTE
jgi:hypothetical protein